MVVLWHQATLAVWAETDWATKQRLHGLARAVVARLLWADAAIGPKATFLWFPEIEVPPNHLF